MIRVLGIDPGPTTGLCLLTINGGPFVVGNYAQCSHGIAPQLIDTLVIGRYGSTLIAAERFVVGRKSMRAGQYGEITRDLLGVIRDTYGDSVRLAAAGEVKPWATDKRLDAIGLLEPTKGMRHARDAARHALYAAVKAGHLPDPLSRKARP